MTRGFAFIAYPAEYRSSGVMTFIVNQDGVVYEKDLGAKTGGNCEGVDALRSRRDVAKSGLNFLAVLPAVTETSFICG